MVNSVSDFSLGTPSHIAAGNSVMTDVGVHIATASDPMTARLIAASLNLCTAIRASDEAEDQMAAMDEFLAVFPMVGRE